ncbi:MAG: TolC family protein [Nitrospirales bacterium]
MSAKMNLKALYFMVFMLLLSGCMVTPTVLTDSEIQTRVNQDLEQLKQNQELVQTPIDLYEAMARALKYNLDAKVELMKTMLAHKNLDLSHYDLLPKLVANTGYDGRNKFSGARSKSLLSGQTSLEPSTSSDKDLFTADLSLSWDVLDFGLSYVRAQQAADDLLIAEEEKRRVANRVIQQVRIAYWRAVSADRMLGRLAHLDDWVAKALKESQAIRQRNLDTPLVSLQYQRELMNTQSEIQKIYHELSIARIELAQLMNLQPGEPYELVVPKRQLVRPDMDIDLETLEQHALSNRPELRQIDYRKRMQAHEAKAAILEMLPSLNLQFGPNYNSNSFLFNNHWLTYGAKISWNLLNLFRKPAQFTMIEIQEQVLTAQSLALTMAVMTQVHIGMAQLTNAQKRVRATKSFYETQKQIGDQVRVSWTANRISEQTVIREHLNNLLAEIRYDVDLAHVEASYANLLGAIGEDTIPHIIPDISVTDLARTLRHRWNNIIEVKPTRRTTEHQS